MYEKFILSIICLFGICFNAFSAETFNPSTGKIDNYSGVGDYKFQDFPPNENIYRESYINRLASLIYGASKNYTDSIDWQIVNPTTYVSNTITKIETIDLEYSFENFGVLQFYGHLLRYYPIYKNGNHIDAQCPWMTWDSSGNFQGNVAAVTLSYGEKTIAKMAKNVAIFEFHVPYHSLVTIVCQGDTTATAGDFVMVWLKTPGNDPKYISLSVTREKYSGAEELQPTTFFAAEGSVIYVIPASEVMFDRTKTKADLLPNIPVALKNVSDANKYTAGETTLLNESVSGVKLHGCPLVANELYYNYLQMQASKIGYGVDSIIPSNIRIADQKTFTNIVCKTHKPVFIGNSNDAKSGWRLLPRYQNATRYGYTADNGDIRYFGSDNTLFGTVLIYPLAKPAPSN